MAAKRPTRVEAILSMKIADKSMKTMKVLPPVIRQSVSRQAWEAQVKRALLRGAKPVVAAARSAALGLPSRGTKSPTLGQRNLRDTIARSIEAQVRGGTRDPAVSVISRRDRLPTDMRFMPKRTNEGRWRHPVMGNTSVWVTQTSTRGWFDNTIRSTANVKVRTELVKVLTFLESRWTR